MTPAWEELNCDADSAHENIRPTRTWHGGRLSDEQSSCLEHWLPRVRLRADMSWNLVDTVVFDVDSDRGRFVIKAAGPDNHHLGRELTAHQGFTQCLVRTGGAAEMVHYDRSANVLVTRYLEGSLVLGSEAESDPDIYRQAGALLRTFHEQAERLNTDWESAALAKSSAWLEKPNRIGRPVISSLKKALSAQRPQSVKVVPTHGDWQPRNWLIDEGTVKAIDFGRFAWRPAITDFCRMAANEWTTDATLEAAFWEGYGGDPRTAKQWRTASLHEAISTAVWAYQVGDEPFENQGHRMIAEALELF